MNGTKWCTGTFKETLIITGADAVAWVSNKHTMFGFIDCYLPIL